MKSYDFLLKKKKKNQNLIKLTWLARMYRKKLNKPFSHTGVLANFLALLISSLQDR